MGINHPLKILYLEDNPDDVGLTRRALLKAGIGFDLHVASNEQDFCAALETVCPDIILSDHSLPDITSLDAFRIVKQRGCDIPFILLTGAVSEEFAVECLLAGIDDYILKSNLIRLPSSIQRVLSKQHMRREKETIEALHNELQSAYRQIELKNKEITDSINYARRIQNAVMPDPGLLKTEFRDGFVIYSPRDIVSGDLYWLTRYKTPELGNYRSVAAVVDCTGHGVPGAFLSLLIGELLNQSLYSTEVTTPGQALSFINRRLIAILNRNSQERVSDGCDMVVCIFDPLQRRLQFAGANRPLWLVRRYAGRHEFFEFKATKATIGAYSTVDQAFESREVDLRPGDRFFMFTDGITDQFGGTKGKKLGKKLFVDILMASAHLSMEEQKIFVDQQLRAWMGQHEQVDDMLLMAMEID